MFSDPVSVTIDSVAHNLSRMPSVGLTGSFNKTDVARLTIAHQNGKRRRSTARLELPVSDDPITGAPRSVTTYVVFDRPNDTGDVTVTDAFIALSTWLNASTQAAVGKILNGEA